LTYIAKDREFISSAKENTGETPNSDFIKSLKQIFKLEDYIPKK